jgi:hypothetical protein
MITKIRDLQGHSMEDNAEPQTQLWWLRQKCHFKVLEEGYKCTLDIFYLNLYVKEINVFPSLLHTLKWIIKS